MTQTNVVEMSRPALDVDIPDVAPNSAALILSGDGMDRMMKLATVMASGRSTVPKHLQGNTGDCMAVIMQAMSWRMNPFAVAQKTHIVNGALGFEAQLINAAIISSGLLADRPQYDWYGDWSRVIGNYKDVESKKNPGETYRKLASTAADEKGCGVKISVTIKGEDQPRSLDLLLTQAGVRNSPLWADDPRQQLAYLAIKRWARLHTPDVILGVYSPDELAEVRPGERDMGAVDVVQETWADKGADLSARMSGGTAGAKKPVERGPLLAEVLKQIAACTTFDQMTVAGEACAKIVNTDEKDKARAAYRERMAALKQAAIDAAAKADAGGPSYAEIAEQINAASSIAAVDAAVDLARSVKDEKQREELIALAARRVEELTPA